MVTAVVVVVIAGAAVVTGVAVVTGAVTGVVRLWLRLRYKHKKSRTLIGFGLKRRLPTLPPK